ncbi:MAG TPA: DCC1-like thiol-disulfide oxidoreductase family protein [Candidatus Kapabacteria bacterium]|nr:DCC1-like thiol-disulfide oxidoreductase family protein [Candidatus Kapabacteria bacterium]
MVKYYLLYDGDCGICSKCAEFVHNKDINATFEILPSQFFEFKLYPGISQELGESTIIVINKENSSYYIEAEAVFRILINLRGIYHILGSLLNNRLLILLFTPIYRLIAINRAIISKLLGLNACKVRY